MELLPSFQHRGIGTSIIHDVIARARAAHLPVTLTVLKENPAKTLYERLGFSVQEEIDTGPTGIKYRMST